jgi:hypothetical protein
LASLVASALHGIRLAYGEDALPKPKGSFASIATLEPDVFDGLNMLEIFGYPELEDARRLLKHVVETGLVHPGFGGPLLPEAQPAPEGEPEGWLICHPNMYRSGVMAFIVEVDGQPTLEGAAVYFSEGVQHRFKLEAISVSSNRSQGILHGVLDGWVQASVYEPAFLADRQWHGEGSDHDIALYALPFFIEVGAPSAIEVEDRLKNDGSMMKINLEGAAMMTPIEDAPPSYYSICGPVKRIREYDLEVLGNKVWNVRVTVCRIGDDQQNDFDLDLFVPDAMWAGGSLPGPGEMVQAQVRLCSRLWMANPFRSVDVG